MKKINIDEDSCIKCGSCASIAPDYIKMNPEDGMPKLEKTEVDENDLSIETAADSCPMGAFDL